MGRPGNEAVTTVNLMEVINSGKAWEHTGINQKLDGGNEAAVHPCTCTSGSTNKWLVKMPLLILDQLSFLSTINLAMLYMYATFY